MIYSNSDQNPIEINLYAAALDWPSGEERDVPSRSSRLIPEYTNLQISGLRQSKIIKEIYNKGSDIPKVCGLIYLFSYVVMSATKSIITYTASFAAKMIHH